MIYDSTNLTQASVNLAKLCDQVVDDRDVVIINRPNSENVALIAADELESLMETAHLLSSPKNAIRLLTALQESNQKTLKPQSVSELHQALLSFGGSVGFALALPTLQKNILNQILKYLCITMRALAWERGG